jgi:hypothetical protein
MCILCTGVVEAEHFKRVSGKGYDAGVYVRPLVVWHVNAVICCKPG